MGLFVRVGLSTVGAWLGLWDGPVGRGAGGARGESALHADITFRLLAPTRQGGQCSSDACPYLHVNLDPSAPVCLEFAQGGYCPNGRNCPRKHLSAQQLKKLRGSRSLVAAGGGGGAAAKACSTA